MAHGTSATAHIARDGSRMPSDETYDGEIEWMEMVNCNFGDGES